MHVVPTTLQIGCVQYVGSMRRVRYHSIQPASTLREEPSQINVILQQKLTAVKLSAVCTVHKQ